MSAIPGGPAARDPAATDPVVEVRDLGVQYDLRFTRRTTMRGWFARLLHRDGSHRRFWALRHVDLRLEHGDSLAVIGPNGAGKSTLLLTLAGIIRPSEGEVAVRGEISALLTLGAGFDQELSGGDNIGLVGAFLGIDGRTMEGLTPAITEYSELGAFIDAPLKTYSTGMRARLGFAIATAVQPDILLLDEVLATGDQVFRARSLVRIRELIREAKAIVLVTHDLEFVTELCNRALLLDHGQVVALGEPAEVVELYRTRTAEQRARQEAEAAVIAAGAQAGGGGAEGAPAGGSGASRA